MNIISAYLGHNASIAVSVDGDILEVLELERMTNIKNCGAVDMLFLKNPKATITLAVEYLKKKYRIKYFDLLLTNHMNVVFLRRNTEVTTERQMLHLFNADKFELVHHQHAHMACAFYQTDLQTAKGISFDGAGSDGNFNVFQCTRDRGITEITKIHNYKLGWRFSEFGIYASSIKKENNFFDTGGLIYPGKLMGLASYGSVRNEWMEDFLDFYKGLYNFSEKPHGPFTNYMRLKEKYNWPESYDGHLEKDIVATAQRAFEIKFEQLAGSYYKNESDFILSGGCALNIINNEKMLRERNIYVPPNPHDGGLALGFLLDKIRPSVAIDATYLGPSAWDKSLLSEYIEKYNASILDINNLIDDLLNGKIIGVIREGSELGPRALGNRSILCHAAVSGMKDIINKKVKNREWYRPFAPVCRQEDAQNFFEVKDPSFYRWMSFCPQVKMEHRGTLESVTHVDGTARLQTVSEQQNSWLYELLSKLAEKSSYPVLLNTSFNIAGKPILNTYRDAVWMLENTEMDGLILEDYYIKKNK